MQRANLVKCRNVLQRQTSLTPEASRQKVAELITTRSEACRSLPPPAINALLDSQFEELDSSRPVAAGYTKRTPERLQFEHTAWWRGFLVVSTLVFLLALALYFVLDRTQRQYLVVGLLVVVTTLVCVAVWRQIRTHGFSGYGAAIRPIVSSSPAPNKAAAAPPAWYAPYVPPPKADDMNLDLNLDELGV